jgi:hypothetical protein
LTRLVSVGVGAGNPAEVAVLESVAVAFEGDDVGVVDEPAAEPGLDRWRPTAVVPRSVRREGIEPRTR